MANWAQKIDSKRKRYNPDVEGYGDASQWTGAFYERMGVKEAEQVLYGKNLSPREILGLKEVRYRHKTAAEREIEWRGIVKAYRAKALANHPDRAAMNGMSTDAATEAFKIISAAYAKLCEEFGK